MKKIRRWSYGVAGSAGALGLAAVLAAAGSPRALADERPKTSKAVQVPVQGGGDAVAPVAGAPPVAEPSLAARPAAGAVAVSPADQAVPAPREGAPFRLRALSFGDGEATLKIDGLSTVVRPGSRIGNHVVKAVVSGRIVLARSPAETTAADATGWGAAPLVIVTFDAAGQGKPRVFWASDPSAPAPAEVKRP